MHSVHHSVPNTVLVCTRWTAMHKAIVPLGNTGNPGRENGTRTPNATAALPRLYISYIYWQCVSAMGGRLIQPRRGCGILGAFTHLQVRHPVRTLGALARLRSPGLTRVMAGLGEGRPLSRTDSGCCGLGLVADTVVVVLVWAVSCPWLREEMIKQDKTREEEERERKEKRCPYEHEASASGSLGF